MTFQWWLFVGIFFSFSAISQQTYILSGTVKDDKNKPLPGASVILSPGNPGAVTDAEGYFIITGLSGGNYAIEVSFLGYQRFADSLVVMKNKTLDIRLKPQLQTLQEVVVTDNYAEQRQREESLNIEVVNDKFLKQHLGGSLMKSLERLPGVSTIDIGSGQSKPVIRGLGFNRVVVVENGIKHEGQQWGADHGLEVDQFAFDRMEVIKGPASLMYGSDAIGGVVDLKQIEIPQKHTLGGSVDLLGKTNNNLAGTSASFFGRREKLFFTFRATLIDYADYRVPADSVDIYSYRAPLYKNRLRNTAGREQNFHFSAGFQNNGASSRFYLSNVRSKTGFFANTHGLEPRQVNTELHDKSARDIQFPYQEVNHLKITNRSALQKENIRIGLELGYQRNFRQEWSKYTSHGYMPAVFPSNLPFSADLERQFDKTVFSGNLKTTFRLNEKTEVSTGLNAEYHKNSIDGRGFIIPAFSQLNTGIFVWMKRRISDRSRLQAGLRYDSGRLRTESYFDWFESPLEAGTDTTWNYLQRAPALKRNFSNLVWSVGYNLNSEQLSFKINIGKSFRMPIAKELAANGVNYHRFSYEVGDPELSPEISYQLDAGLEWHTPRFAAGITPFVNYFPNYIYLNPGFEHDRLYGNGNQVFYYTESEVLRVGGELHAHYNISRYLKTGVIFDCIRSEQLSGDKKGFTLPFSPPASALFNLKYTPEKLAFFKHPYVSLDLKIVADQNQIVPPEEKTPGYTLMNLGMGADIRIKNQLLLVSVQAQNLLDEKYFNHTSYYRLINVPAPGRNVVVNINIPFSVNLK